MKLHQFITHQSEPLVGAQNSFLDARLGSEDRSAVNLVLVAGLGSCPSEPNPFWLDPEEACIAPGRPASRATS